MKRPKPYTILFAILAGAAVLTALWAQQTTPPAQSGTPAKAPASAQKAPARSTAPAPMTNQDVVKLVKAKVADDLIIAKIKQSKTRFDVSVDGLVALKGSGVSDAVISVMMNPAAPAATAPPPAAPAAANTSAPPSAPKSSFPASNVSKELVANETNVARKGPPPANVTSAPPNFGVYIWSDGELKPLGRVQTKVQVSKFRSLLKSMVPFVRQKIDIDIPGAHSTSRYEVLRPTFFAFFPPSRDVSKFKLLQCKITGQRFDQRTLANASILFSTEQNQDEVLCDIGPTAVRDLYRISPREDLPSGEFGFVEGNTGSKSTSNIEILDVYDFAVDRKEDKMALKDYLETLPPVRGDRAFMEWPREDCQKIVADRTGKVGLTGSFMGFFDRQYGSLDVYWADNQFAQAFARLEMLDKDLTPDQTAKLANLLTSGDSGQYYILVSIGGKVGSGKLIGANEGERLMRPFDASLADEKSKDIIPAKHLNFIGGYAGLWKVAFDQKSIRGPLLQNGLQRIQFEARLNQNLEFSAKFQVDKLNALPSESLGRQ
ncbi:MAG TPA: hypothetical protein VMH81_27655 [Bryobacteraceae bacterium]|nr:hypothetical protein [Bryobacteraceae bacterium]